MIKFSDYINEDTPEYNLYKGITFLKRKLQLRDRNKNIQNLDRVKFNVSPQEEISRCTKILLSNIHCKNCVDCQKCRGCENSVSCINCNGIYNSSNCVDCKTCEDIHGCTKCTALDWSKDCVSCRACVKCYSCVGCFRCRECVGCNKCDNSIGLNNKNGIKGSAKEEDIFKEEYN